MTIRFRQETNYLSILESLGTSWSIGNARGYAMQMDILDFMAGEDET